MYNTNILRMLDNPAEDLISYLLNTNPERCG